MCTTKSHSSDNCYVQSRLNCMSGVVDQRDATRLTCVASQDNIFTLINNLTVLWFYYAKNKLTIELNQEEYELIV